MTTYMLALGGDDQRLAEASRWAGLRNARLLSVSRPSRTRAYDGSVVAAHGAVDPLDAGRAGVTRDPAALAALLVRTLDLQDGAGVVMADFDSEEFAAAVVARIAALGRRVTRPGTSARSAWASVVRPRTWRFLARRCLATPSLAPPRLTQQIVPAAIDGGA